MIDAITTVFILAMFIANIALTIYNKVPILNFVVGAFTFIIGVSTMGNSEYPFQPYLSLLFVTLSALCALSAGIRLKHGGD